MNESLKELTKHVTRSDSRARRGSLFLPREYLHELATEAESEAAVIELPDDEWIPTDTR